MPREVKYKGHRTDSGGLLQGHSIGDSYPYAVVGCMVHDLTAPVGAATSPHTRYFILDAATGRRYVKRASGWTFLSIELAHKTALDLASGLHFEACGPFGVREV